MNTNIKKLIIGILSFGWFASALFSVPAYAATSQVNFDPNSGTLSVSGSCSSNFVLVVIRRASDHSIWGSSNPDCVNGSYTYSIVVPSGDRDGENFVVAAMDGNDAGQSMASMKQNGNSSATPVTFSAPIPTTDFTIATITLDTSTLNIPPDDTSVLDSILQNCFGIITSALNAAEASVVAAVHMFAKIFTIIPGGSITVPRGQDQISGMGTLAAGASAVFIANTAVTSSSQIIVTPTSASQLPLAVVQIVDGDGFSVGTISPQQMPISFTWLVVGTYAAGPPTQAGLQQGSQGSQSAAAVTAPTNPAPPEATTTDTADDSSSTIVASTTDSIDITTTPDTTDTTDTVPTVTTDATPDATDATSTTP